MLEFVALFLFCGDMDECSVGLAEFFVDGDSLFKCFLSEDEIIFAHERGVKVGAPLVGGKVVFVFFENVVDVRVSDLHGDK